MRDSEVRYTAEYLKKNRVIGGRVVDVEVLDGDDPLACLVVERADGTEVLLWIMCDPEGNGPGWIDVQDVDEDEEDED